ncbi:hypothetical protein [Streptomyces sp. OE57]|uniref:hypothetical protein n=1 Tax=Streptomyces lacaronensis TaxID=3379885 RepID=UPI0039B748B8
MGPVNDGRIRPWGGVSFLRCPFDPLFGGSPPTSFQELAMADVAFVIATIAVFALVAFVAKGVTKL